ncbi:Gem-associated protein 8 [Eumeta japonica]|uniref:Gem-associated protein 8 n=1 Tax=Eumeta variegata TaxID=151549 RepID=A0A4C1YYZ1_EUMVA|nr:Gem-associated protein 8 [Eumeta japonica]
MDINKRKLHKHRHQASAVNSRKKNKRKKNNKLKHNAAKSDFVLKNWSLNRETMASWAETYTEVATWRFKHEIAYWKAKAKALEYENNLLHDIIRSHHMVGTSTSHNLTSNINSSSEDEDDSDQDADENQDCDGLELSEEYIAFVKANAKYREDARLERERLKQECGIETISDITKRMEAPPIKEEEDYDEHKKLYGEHWQQIVALETSLHSEFMLNCNKYKPSYWPNIPFNFNF